MSMTRRHVGAAICLGLAAAFAADAASAQTKNITYI
jgi:hypothetical protein